MVAPVSSTTTPSTSIVKSVCKSLGLQPVLCAASRRGRVNAQASTRAAVRRGDTKEEVAPECHNENQLGHLREFIEQIVSVKQFCFLDMVE